MHDIGVDCDFILVHPLVNDGDPYGFVLAPDPSKSGPAVSVQRSLDDSDEVLIYLFVTVLLADDLKNPDGTQHSADRDTMYSMLLDYLEQIEGLSIGTFIGTYLGIGPAGHTYP